MSAVSFKKGCLKTKCIDSSKHPGAQDLFAEVKTGAAAFTGPLEAPDLLDNPLYRLSNQVTCFPTKIYTHDYFLSFFQEYEVLNAHNVHQFSLKSALTDGPQPRV